MRARQDINSLVSPSLDESVLAEVYIQDISDISLCRQRRVKRDAIKQNGEGA